MDFKKIYKTLKKGNNPGKIIMTILILVVLIGESQIVYKSIQIRKYQNETTGKLVDYYDSGWRGDILVYEFKVNGEKYINKIGVTNNSKRKLKDAFEKEFVIKYSGKEPKYNIILLEEFDKYRNTVEYYDF